jgi:hypothetical protein
LTNPLDQKGLPTVGGHFQHDFASMTSTLQLSLHWLEVLERLACQEGDFVRQFNM